MAGFHSRTDSGITPGSGADRSLWASGSVPFLNLGGSVNICFVMLHRVVFGFVRFSVSVVFCIREEVKRLLGMKCRY